MGYDWFPRNVVSGRTYTYDAEGRITSATGLPVNSLVTFDYDGGGRRVRKTVGSSVTISVYDAMGNLAAEYENQPAVPPCATCYFTTDHLGSTRVVTDAAGNVVRRYDYAPFGEEIPAGINGRAGAYRTSQGMTVPDALKEEFTGKERDTETGLDYFGARYMSAAQGRFTSPDRPFADQHYEVPQSWNLYTYARNNPLRYVDLNGEAVIDAGRVRIGTASFRVFKRQSNLDPAALLTTIWPLQHVALNQLQQNQSSSWSPTQNNAEGTCTFGCATTFSEQAAGITLELSFRYDKNDKLIGAAIYWAQDPNAAFILPNPSPSLTRLKAHCQASIIVRKRSGLISRAAR